MWIIEINKDETIEREVSCNRHTDDFLKYYKTRFEVTEEFITAYKLSVSEWEDIEDEMRANPEDYEIQIEEAGLVKCIKISDQSVFKQIQGELLEEWPYNEEGECTL